MGWVNTVKHLVMIIRLLVENNTGQAPKLELWRGLASRLGLGLGVLYNLGHFEGGTLSVKSTLYTLSVLTVCIVLPSFNEC